MGIPFGDNNTYINVAIDGSYQAIYAKFNVVGGKTTFTVPDGSRVTGIRIRISSGVVVPDNFKCYPQITAGEEYLDFIPHEGTILSPTSGEISGVDVYPNYTYICAQSGVTGAVSYVASIIANHEERITDLENRPFNLVGKKIKRSNDITEYTYYALRDAVEEIIDIPGKSMTEMLEEKKAQGEPLVVMFVGINGTGKTTTIGKLANYYLKMGYTPVIAASDTFRAGAIEQVTHHADNVGVKIIKHQKGSDPAAVAFDAVEHARAQGKELVLIDTAGRMQTNTNLMDEMKKIKRVSKPDLVIFVGDAITGNDATEQARKFNEAIDIDGVILTKAYADSKGGASLSIGYVIKKPILFLGVGQGYDDIMEYDSQWMLNQLFSDDDGVAEEA